MLSDNLIHFVKDEGVLCGSLMATKIVYKDLSKVTCQRCRELAGKPNALEVDPELANMGVGDLEVDTKPPEPCEKKTPCLKDDDFMPFGKYKGERMKDVPASYLHWLWTQRPLSNRKLENYIFNNIPALKKEYKDGIWT